MSQTVRIFVSSPSDVPAERKAVERVALRVAGQYRHIEIKVYRWESGNYFSAHTGFQEQIEEIGGFDLVVGILWSRIGTPLPPNFGATMPPPREGQPYPSGTAFEIIEAIRWRTERGAETPDILVYQKRATAPSAPPDDHAAHEELDRQRKAIASFIHDFFSSPSDGVTGAFKPFDTLPDFENVFGNDLLAWLRDNRSLARQRRWRVEELGSPFRGLDPFDASHREVFFGRRAEIERAQERLADGNGFLLIDGASGTGKSSLARAGLLPRMQDLDPDLRVAITQPESDMPLLTFAQALFEPRALPELADGDYNDATVLGRHLAGGGDVAPILRALDRANRALSEREKRDVSADLRLVVLVDQCEALITSRISEGEQSSYGAVLEALVVSGRVQVIATLRANAREKALSEPAFGRLIDAQQGLSLGPPTPDAFGEIVRGPAEAASLAFERDDSGVGLDELLLRDVSRDPDALPLLQFALQQLYEKAAERVQAKGVYLGDVEEDEPVLTLTHTDYSDLGGLSGAIGHQADAALRTVSADARRRLPSLVRTLTVGGSGATVLGRASVAVAVPDAPTGDLVEALLNARILVRGVCRDETSDVVVDQLRFAHERVLTAWDKASEAAAAAQNFLRVRSDLSLAEARWCEGGKRADLLLPAGLRIAEAESILSEFGPELDRQNPLLRIYIQASGRFARRRQRLAQLAAAGFAAVAVAAGWFAYQSGQNSRLAASNADIAVANERMAVSNAEEAAVNARAAVANAFRAEEEAKRAAEAQALAETERDRAEQALRAANAAASGLAQELAAGTKNWPGVDKNLINRMLIRAQNILLISLAAGGDDVSQTQRSLAIVYSGMADIQISFGNYGLANKLARDALRMFEILHEKGYEPHQVPTDIQIVRRKIAEAEEQLGHIEATLKVLRDGLAMIAAQDSGSASLAARHQAALNRMILGRVLSRSSDTRDEGIAELQSAAAELANIFGDSQAIEVGTTNEIARDVAKRRSVVAYYLGKAYLDKNDDQLAIEALQDVSRHFGDMASMTRNGLADVDMRRLQVDAGVLLSTALLRHDQPQYAAQVAAKAVVDVRNLMRADGRRREHVEQLVFAYLVLAGAFERLDQISAARDVMSSAIDERQSLADAAPNDASLHLRLAELQLYGARLGVTPVQLAKAAISTVIRFTSHVENGAEAQEIVDSARALIAEEKDKD